MGCTCKVCTLTGKVAAVQAKLSPEDRAVIEELLTAWEHEGMDAGYYRAVVRGAWPHCKRIASAPKSPCAHEWKGEGEMPAKWDCACGTRVYRSYADYCWD